MCVPEFMLIRKQLDGPGQGPINCSVKSQIVNTLGFVDDVVSVSTIQPWLCKIQTAIDNRRMVLPRFLDLAHWP